MSSFIRLFTYVAIGVAAAVLTTDMSRAALDTSKASRTKPPQTQPQSGTVRIKFVKAGIIVGVGSGSGSLTFRGKTYQLSIGGVDVGSVGISSVQLAGTANNLRNVADIAGTYNAAGGGATIGAGNKAATVQNEKGVVLKLRGLQTGFQASLGLSGMTITLQ
jgi:hypothetical protein